MSLKAIASYFDLRKKPSRNIIKPLAEPNNYMWLQYIAVFVGIVVQPFIEHYMKYNGWDVTLGTLGSRTLFGLVIGLAIFPAVYKRSWDNTSPLLVQLCSIFSAGLGWQTLFSAGAQAI